MLEIVIILNTWFMIAEKLQTIYTKQESCYKSCLPEYQKAAQLIKLLEKQAGTDFQKLLTPRQLDKGEFLLRQGAQASYLWIFEKGIAREFLTNERGRSISHFFVPGRFVSNYNSVLNHCPSRVSIQLVTTAHVFQVEWKALRLFEEKYPVVGQLERLLVNAVTEERKIHSNCMQQLSAGEYYDYLIANCPLLKDQVPYTDLASYLGISLSSLSRIRGKYLL